MIENNPSPQFLKTAMKLENINLTTRIKKSRALAKKYFQAKLIKPAKKGRGVISYEGFTNERQTVFIGLNKKLDTTMVSFSGQEGMQEFEQFRKDALNLAENKEASSGFTISSIKALVSMDPPQGVKTSGDLAKMLEQTVQAQQKSIPKASVDKNKLFIGGQTGNTCVQIHGLIERDSSVKKLLVSVCLKDRSGKNFFEYVLGAINSDFNAILAFFIIQQLGRLTLTDLTDHVIKFLVQSFEVSRVSGESQIKARSTTSKGKAVIRSLKALLNKLVCSDTTEETKILLKNWVSQVYNEHLQEISEGQKLVEEILEILNRAPNITTQKPKTAQMTLDRDQFFRSPSPDSEELPK